MCLILKKKSQLPRDTVLEPVLYIPSPISCVTIGYHLNMAFTNNLSKTPISKTIQEALAKSEQKRALDDEMNALVKNGT